MYSLGQTLSPSRQDTGAQHNSMPLNLNLGILFRARSSDFLLTSQQMTVLSTFSMAIKGEPHG